MTIGRRTEGCQVDIIMIDIGEPDDYQVENGRQVDLTDIR